MKAMIWTKYGPPDVLQLQEIDTPIPKGNEVLVKVHAASLNAGDLKVMRGESFILRIMNGLRKPKHKILGDDIAGEVEAVGKNIKQFQPGDEVFGVSVFGAFAEYGCFSEKYLARKPASLSFEEAAAIPMAAITALQGLRDKGQIQDGQKVLINGASGGVGTFAVQIAKYYGAEVTGVCSTMKLDMVQSIGADYVLDYTKEKFTEKSERYDLILDLAAHHSLREFKRALSPKGIYVCIGGTMAQYIQTMLLGPLITLRGSKKMHVGFGNPNKEDYEFLIRLFEAGKVVPVIDRSYPLSEIVEAFHYFEEGHAQGKVVITMK
ncbi:MAG: NAD(P)-dependent alcohol dehydrogenase [Candidatus Thorarchaeota archaeon]